MYSVNARGAEIPALGFGTFELEPHAAGRMVDQALQLGYRHIDTAQIYGNEGAVGEAIAQASVRRDEVFLTTKVWINAMRPGKLEASVEASLDRLRTDYVDLLLLHWPNPKVDFQAMFDSLARVHDQGLARHVGVSNYPVAWVRRAVEACEAPLLTNQVEYHPFLSQRTLKAELDRLGMILTAYSPLARGGVFRDPTLKRIGEAHGKTPGQIALRWLLQQRNVVAIPRSSREDNARANLEVFDFELNEMEMREIAELARPGGRTINPEGLAPDWDK
jgi:2,5-diketo-D-gluconate reductase B